MAQYTSSFTGAQIDEAVTKANGLPSTSVSAAQNGTTLSLVTTGEKYAWNNGGKIDYDVTTSNIQNIDSTIISQALRKTAQELTSAEKTQVMTNLGISSSQLRSITISTEEPTSSDGVDGDIWLMYEEEE